MACNYKHLKSLEKARIQLNSFKDAINEIPLSIWVALILCKIEEVEALMNYLEEACKNE